MKEIIFNNRQYNVIENESNIIFKDKSNQPFKINFSFSKDKEKNKEAEEGLRIFFTELFSK
jgi:hypothetical protein